ncbi:cupin domain-containing protein [Streptomyces fulvoviolaceus]|uniref:cupin domain-containing protein n=1 Tax=Streptomyces fulvoviolaceus TaxID=285535 RepID=UPI0021C07BFC|nr:cupin domain-containing protein [Streptomyces fulvoviolaceus]MCT9083693.1 cupin domain-containing protein [Streptomyces fulvoviolaceus]
MDGLIVPPGQGRRIVTRAQEMTFKVTGADGGFASVFEVVVPPGFDSGAHFHSHSQEFFYLLEGELDLLSFEPKERSSDGWHDWEAPDGRRVVRAGAGSAMFVPEHTPHAFANRTGTPARMLFQCAPPPDHERYFEELADIFTSGASVDSEAVQRLRVRYDVTQLTPLHFTPARAGAGSAS